MTACAGVGAVLAAPALARLLLNARLGRLADDPRIGRVRLMAAGETQRFSIPLVFESGGDGVGLWTIDGVRECVETSVGLWTIEGVLKSHGPREYVGPLHSPNRRLETAEIRVENETRTQARRSRPSASLRATGVPEHVSSLSLSLSEEALGKTTPTRRRPSERRRCCRRGSAPAQQERFRILVEF